jgi:hypothetical protein
MAPDMTGLLGMIRDSIATPRTAAERVLSLHPSSTELVMAVALVAALDAILAGLTGVGIILIPSADGTMEQFLPPFAHAAALVALLLLFAGAFQASGQVLGGRGRFSASLSIVVWLEVVSLAIQAAQALVLFLVPQLASFAAIGGAAILLWCLVHFMRALHGFQGLGRTILAILLASLGAALALSVLLAILGIGAPTDV